MEHHAYRFAVQSRTIREQAMDIQPYRGRISIGDSMLSDDLRTLIPPAARDLFRVATAVFQVDRLAPRAPASSKGLRRALSWARDIELEIAVEDPRRWTDACERVEALLGFLTDDHWRLSFFQERFLLDLPLDSKPQPLNAELALFSGGLDSSAGLAARHRERPLDFLALSLFSHGARSHQQGQVVELLRSQGVSVRRIRFDHCLRQPPLHPGELSQRTRGFLFLGVGAAVAATLGLGAVATYESGIGSINLRMSDGQVGAQSTRAMHPGTLVRMEALLEAVLDRPIRLEVPFFWKTKGEVCAQVRDQVSSIAQVAMSCDEGERNKSNSNEHCGQCTSCLLRRSALHAALGSGDPTRYRDHETRGHGAFDVETFHFQALELRDAAEDYGRLLALDPAMRDVETYFQKRSMPRDQIRAGLCSLYARYADEVLAFLDELKPPSTPRPGRPSPPPPPIRQELYDDLFPAAG